MLLLLLLLLLLLPLMLVLLLRLLLQLLPLLPLLPLLRLLPLLLVSLPVKLLRPRCRPFRRFCSLSAIFTAGPKALEAPPRRRYTCSNRHAIPRS